MIWNEQLAGDRDLSRYSQMCEARNIQYIIFNENEGIVYPTDGRILLMDEEWARIQDGQTVTVKQELKRFDQAVTFVLLPYMHNGEFTGGLLLTSPRKRFKGNDFTN